MKYCIVLKYRLIRLKREKCVIVSMAQLAVVFFLLYAPDPSKQMH